MTQKQLLNGLKKRLQFLSRSQIASELGYRTPNTIASWINKKQIPKCAIARLELYLKEVATK